MSVLIEAISVVVAVTTIDHRYPGGYDRFIVDAPNKTLCSDGHLVRIGFMAPTDVEHFSDRLSSCGIELKPDPSSSMAVIDQVGGPTQLWDWLGVHEYGPGIHGAYLLGQHPGDLVLPEPWSLEQHRDLADNWRLKEEVGRSLHRVGTDRFGSSMIFDESDGRIKFQGTVFDHLDDHQPN